MKMKPTVSSETSAIRTQTPGNYPKRNKLHLEHGKRLKTKMKIDNSSFEKLEGFKYLGKTLTNQNSIQEEIKSRWNSGNACCHSVQNLLSSTLLSKNLRSRYTEL